MTPPAPTLQAPFSGASADAKAPASRAPSAFSLQTARACVRASRLAYESPTITTRRCHVTLLETVCGTAAQHSSDPSDPSDLSDTLHAPCLIVAFRGTANLVDFLTDAKCWRTVIPSPASRIANPAALSVHSGFWLSLLEIFEPLSDYISRLAPRPLIVTGHSLGGALAVLFTYKWHCALADLGPSGFGLQTALFPILATYTFGQPRCANRAFAACYDTFHRASTFRCVNEEDLVPRIPGVLAGYRHAGQEVFFPSQSSSPAAPKLQSEGGSTFWLNPPFWRKLLSDARGLYAACRRQPAAALGQLLLDHHISNYVARLCERPTAARNVQ